MLLDLQNQNTLLKEYKTIDPEDVNIYKVVDTAEEAYEIILNSKPREI